MNKTICTAPCYPRCDAIAINTIKSLNGTVLGHNCAVHTPQKNAKDYFIEPMEEENAE